MFFIFIFSIIIIIIFLLLFIYLICTEYFLNRMQYLDFDEFLTGINWSILCSKIVDFKFSVFVRDLAMGLVVWLTKKL